MNRESRLVRHAAVIAVALAAAEETNRKLFALATTQSQPERVRIRRVILFEVESGVDYGFVREEFGGIEPFAAVPVPRLGTTG